MSKDAIAGIIYCCIIVSGLYAISLVRYSDTNDLKFVAFSIWKNLLLTLFYNKNAFGIIIGIIGLILNIIPLIFVSFGIVLVWIYVIIKRIVKLGDRDD